MKNGNLVVGVDIGGTKVAAGLVNPQGEILFKTRAPMVTTEDAATGFAAVKQVIQASLNAPGISRENLAGVGIGVGGPLDQRTGVVINPPNLPCWKNFPVAGEVKRAFGVAARVDNDGNAAALAEALWGRAVGFENVFYATIGTGIGTGIVFGRRIYYGRTGAAAEGGHVVIDYRGPRCGCGKKGCIEALASGTALARRARERLVESPDSKMIELAGGDIQAVTGEIVTAAAQARDPLAQELLDETRDFLVIWLGVIIDLLEPDVIVIGGGMSGLVESWFDQIRDQLPAWCINQRCREIPLLRAAYGEDAGIVGAAALLHQP